MKLLLFLLGSSRRTVYLIAVAGISGGALSTALIAFVNHAINHGEAVSSTFVAAFVLLVVGRSVINACAQLLIVRFSQRTIADLRLKLCRRILTAPLRRLEKTGSAHLIGVLIEDVQAITSGLVTLPSLAVNASILVGCSVYLAWLSASVFIALGLVIALGFACYRLLVAHAFSVFRHVRDGEGKLFEHYRGLTEGIKELKLHRGRREAFLTENIEPRIEAVRHYGVAASNSFIVANNLVQFLFYALIGVILFVIPKMADVGAEVVTGYVIGVLYLVRPLEVVMDLLPAFARTMAAIGKTEELDLSLIEHGGDSRERVAPASPPASETIELIGIRYEYEEESSEHAFKLGPIDLRVEPGELLFITGGNGSGKSTLAKVLTGLYPPDGGEIRVAGEVVTAQTRDDYRQRFASVFSDFYLFERLLGLSSPDLSTQARVYLHKLELNHKVTIEDGVFSTTDLSQGQRKRLALLTAYLEDRPCYVFDEWAADQDKEFKEVFYSKLLPELKEKNKSVIVISHDDRYYHVADRITRLDSGRLVEP